MPGAEAYLIAERFKSVQGEGCYAGTPMAFIRFVGCSVGKKTCHACDTDFEHALPWRGGGRFDSTDLKRWAMPYEHICLTGGEPLDQDIRPMLFPFAPGDGVYTPMLHIETSGTRPLPLDASHPDRRRLWICVSPKPGFIEDVVLAADEVKVIVPGLGSGSDWPTPDDALRWAAAGKIVFLQPRNAKFDIDKVNLTYVQDLLHDYPQLRLSVQLHKILKVQ